MHVPRSLIVGSLLLLVVQRFLVATCCPRLCCLWPACHRQRIRLAFLCTAAFGATSRMICPLSLSTCESWLEPAAYRFLLYVFTAAAYPTDISLIYPSVANSFSSPFCTVVMPERFLGLPRL